MNILTSSLLPAGEITGTFNPTTILFIILLICLFGFVFNLLRKNVKKLAKEKYYSPKNSIVARQAQGGPPIRAMEFTSNQTISIGRFDDEVDKEHKHPISFLNGQIIRFTVPTNWRSISRYQCLIVPEFGILRVYDGDIAHGQSKNGTKLNGTTVASDGCDLHNGDIITIGLGKESVNIRISLQGMHSHSMQDSGQTIDSQEDGTNFDSSEEPRTKVYHSPK